jgi:hypothetical protein
LSQEDVELVLVSFFFFLLLTAKKTSVPLKFVHDSIEALEGMTIVSAFN